MLGEGMCPSSWRGNLTVRVGVPLPIEGVVLPDVFLALRHQQRVAHVAVMQVLQQHALHGTQKHTQTARTEQQLI